MGRGGGGGFMLYRFNIFNTFCAGHFSDVMQTFSSDIVSCKQNDTNCKIGTSA